MKAVVSFLLRGLSAAAVAFTVMKLTYGSTEYAAVGPLSVSVDMLMKVVPGLMGVVFPLVVQKWPALASFANLVFAILKYRSPETASMLGKVSALEVYAEQQGSSAMRSACKALRDGILQPETTNVAAKQPAKAE